MQWAGQKNIEQMNKEPQNRRRKEKFLLRRWKFFALLFLFTSFLRQIQYSICLRTFVKPHEMSTREYVFIDQFFAACDTTDAYDYIANIRDYPQWWGNVYKKIEKLNDVADDQPGVQYAVTIGGFLPYKLTISNEVTHIHKPHIIRFKAFGDLQGHGTWYFNAVEGGTTITFDWRVVANKAVIRWFSFLLKPLFRANHHYCVKEAEKGIRNDLIRNGRLSPQTVMNHGM